MRTLEQNFNALWQLAVGGKYFRVISATSDIDVLFYRGGMVVSDAFGVGAGYYAMPENGFERIEIKAAGACTVKIAVSDGGGGYDLVAVTGSISSKEAPAASASYGAVTVGLAASQIVAANANRRTVLVQNRGAASIFVAPDNAVTTANGIEVAAGANFTYTGATALYGISGTAGQDVRYLDEVN